MRFKKIRMKNIRSYTDQELTFPEGSLLLSGDVGSGKTSILLALEYALFGLQPGQKGSSLLKINENLGEVSLELEILGESILIERKLKRTNKGVSNEYAAITIGGKKTESSVTEIKSKIIDLLGYPPEFVKRNNVLYRYTVYSPQEQMKQIILEDSETRLNILRQVFGIDKYKLIKENLAILLYDLKGEVKVLQGEISTLEKDKENIKLRKIDIRELEDKIDLRILDFNGKKDIRRKAEEELGELNIKIEEKRNFSSEIDKARILCSTKKDFLLSVNNELEDIKTNILEVAGDFNQDRFKNLLEKINLMKSSIERTTFRLSDLQSHFNLSEKESKEILSKRDRIFKIDICPTCLQDVPETHRHNILNESENKLAKIKAILAGIKNEEEVLSIELRNYKKEMQNLDEEKTQSEILKSKLEYAVAWKQKLIKFSESKIKIEEDITLLEKHISSLRESISKYAIFEVRLRRNEIELKQAMISEKNAEISLAELRKEIELLRREISLLDGDIIRKEERKRKLYSVSELIDWLSTQFLKLIEFAERNVMLKLRSEFSTLFQKWFLMLVPENSLSTQIDENFTPIIMQNESEMDYSFLSGGERTAVALAYRLALNQIINSVLSKIRTRGIIILDEPTDGFSESQIGKIRDILEDLNTKQLIIVSHEQKIESFVDNILKVTKENGSSTVEIPKEESRKDLPQSLNIQELSSNY